AIRHGSRVARRPAALRGHHAGNPLARRPPFVEPHPDADVAKTLALARQVGGNFAQGAAFEIRQFEILEHDLDQFLERDVGFVVIDTGLIARFAFALARAVLPGLADDLSRLRAAVTSAHTRRVVTVDEAVFLDSAQRNLDDLVLVFADDRFFGDDIGDILANRFADLLPMAQAVAG